MPTPALIRRLAARPARNARGSAARRPPARRVWRLAVPPLACMLAATACSTKAEDATGSSQGGIKVGPGVTEDTLSLGVIADLTGVFAGSDTTITNGQKLYWDELNDKGGICGRRVKLTVRDHGYDVQRAVTAYSQLRTEVLDFPQIFGSAINAALMPKYEQDDVLVWPASAASSLAESEQILMIGTHYDHSVIGEIGYALDKGLIEPKDTIGHIYLEGEYGVSSLAGSTYMARKHGLELVQRKVKATDTDLSAQVAGLKSAGVKAIVLSVAPKQAAAVASAAEGSGLDVPLLADSSGFDAGLLTTSAASALEENLYLMEPWKPASAVDPAVQRVVRAYGKSHPGKEADDRVVYGYAATKVYAQVLKDACAAKDLTRAGVAEAKSALGKVDSDGLFAPLDYSEPGTPPATGLFVSRPDRKAVGGLELVQPDPYEAEDLAGYTPAGS